MMDFNTKIFDVQRFYRVCKLYFGLILIYFHTFNLFYAFLRQVIGPPLKNLHFVLPVWLMIGQEVAKPAYSQHRGHYFANHHKYGNQSEAIILYNASQKFQVYMVDNLSLQLDPRRIKEQHDLKKLLPKGSCSVQQYKKYEYIRNFLKDRFVYRYILPINHIYAPFVVIKRSSEFEKYPIYQLYHHPTSAFILSAQEQNMNIGCNYLISSKEKPAKNEFFIAKLRGNFNRNQFHIFDNGSNPDKQKSNPRKQLAYITVEESSIWNKNQKMTMYVPRAYESNRSISEIHKYEPIEFLCQSKNPNPILQDFKEKYNTVESLQLKQLKPTQNKGSTPDGFVLESSVRTETVVVRKKSQTYFQLGIGSPLTIVQGFGFLLTLIQAKLI